MKAKMLGGRLDRLEAAIRGREAEAADLPPYPLWVRRYWGWRPDVGFWVEPGWTPEDCTCQGVFTKLRGRRLTTAEVNDLLDSLPEPLFVPKIIWMTCCVSSPHTYFAEDDPALQVLDAEHRRLSLNSVLLDDLPTADFNEEEDLRWTTRQSGAT